MAHLDSSHHPGLFYEYVENLDISWPLTFSCIDSLQCGVSSFLGPWLVFRVNSIIYRVTEMDDFFALGNYENQPKEGLVWFWPDDHSQHDTIYHYRVQEITHNQDTLDKWWHHWRCLTSRLRLSEETEETPEMSAGGPGLPLVVSNCKLKPGGGWLQRAGRSVAWICRLAEEAADFLDL